MEQQPRSEDNESNQQGDKRRDQDGCRRQVLGVANDRVAL